MVEFEELSEGMVSNSAHNQVQEEEIVSVVTKIQVYKSFDLLKMYAAQCM